MDKAEETGLSILRATTAANRGDKLGNIMGNIVSLTTIVPSEIRESREEKGVVLDEVGNALAFFGSRPGRIIFNSTSALLPKFQPISDGLGAAANIYASFYRLTSADKRVAEGYTPEQRVVHKKRKQAMHVMEAAMVGRMGYKLLQRSRARANKYR